MTEKSGGNQVYWLDGPPITAQCGCGRWAVTEAGPKLAESKCVRCGTTVVLASPQHLEYPYGLGSIPSLKPKPGNLISSKEMVANAK